MRQYITLRTIFVRPLFSYLLYIFLILQFLNKIFRNRIFKPTHFYSSLALYIIFPFLLGMTHSELNKIDTFYFNAGSNKEFRGTEILILNLMKSHPNQTRLIWRLARNYFGLAKRTSNKEQKLNIFGQCFNTVKKGIVIDKNSAENIYFMGLCLGNISLQRGILSSLSNREILRTSMERAVEINPNVEHAGPHRFLGVYYNVLPFFLGGDSEKAIQHLESAVNLSPDHAENYFFLGKVYFDNGHYSKANNALEQFLKLAKRVKNDSDLPKQIEEAHELCNRIKTYQNSD